MDSTADIQLRLANAEDFAIIEELSLSHLNKDQRKIYYQRAHGNASRFKSIVKGESGVCLVACVKAEIIGYIVGAPVSTALSNIKYVELENIFVRSEYRRLGIGKRLGEVFLIWARENKFERVAVKMGWKKQKELMLFYEEFGFAPVTIELELKLNNNSIS